jgi:transglutaminase-like putative cysteine protease
MRTALRLSTFLSSTAGQSNPNEVVIFRNISRTHMNLSSSRSAPSAARRRRKKLEEARRHFGRLLPRMSKEAKVKIRVGYELIYDCPQPTPMMLVLNIHYTRASDLLVPDYVTTDPSIPINIYRDGFGNWCSRIVAPKGQIRITSSAVVKDSGEPDVVARQAQQHAIQELPEEVLVFLLASRYCDTEKLVPIAWNSFGQTRPGWDRVQAICDFVHNHISFGYEHASSTRTAWETFNERRGVCRDFAHLAIALCRCMNIPARYCTGYLGDIGIPPPYGPMDFSAWFEAYLGGSWYTFDARNNIPRIGRVLMARGRDAIDVAISTTFGANVLVGFKVWTDEVD